MRWQFLDPNLQGLQIDVTGLHHTACVVTQIQDYRTELLNEEIAELECMAELRQHGFASGRHCAHLAQSSLDLNVEPILRQNRVPLWPTQCTGSITHSQQLAAAIVSTELAGVGIDIEELGRVDEKLYRMLFTETEKANIEHLSIDAATLIFSAKEAGYKAIYPIGEQFIGFKEAEIAIDESNRSFKIAYLGAHEKNKALNDGFGYWQVHDGHVVTVFVIPHK